MEQPPARAALATSVIHAPSHLTGFTPCNPQELVWREVRRQPFGNHDFDSMDLVETALEHRLRQLESSPAQIQSLTGFDWIGNISLNAKSY